MTFQLIWFYIFKEKVVSASYSMLAHAYYTFALFDISV